MSINHTALSTVADLDALSTLIASEAWGDYLKALATDEDTDAEILALREAVAAARSRLSPERASRELCALKEQVYAMDGTDPALMRPLLARIDALRAALPTRAHDRIFGRLETRIGELFVWMNGGSGYSNRARRASSLFTDFAGQTHIAGADTNRHGNAAGTDYDLGRDGAFTGQTVHLLNLIGVGMDHPIKALERKGFSVNECKNPGSIARFTQWLSDATQLWVISDRTRKLKAEHIAAIDALWRRGGALYIWGDNDPFYADANAITTALFDDAQLNQKGNTIGDRVVGELSDGVGFLPHLVSTGLVNLYEGITIASINTEAARRHGFMPLMYGSAKNLVTAVREPEGGRGPFMIDTGFTRLYYKWDDAGSARFVCNAGCYLAASVMPVEVEEPAPEVVDEPLDALPLEPAGAFVGVCDLTGKTSPTWMVLSVTALGDALRNTGDFTLTDPLSAAAGNDVFADVLYTESMGQWILNQPASMRKDPITQAPVIACLPLVDLSHRKNMEAFTDILCVCLMDGKRLPTAARLVFFAVVEELLSRPDLTHRDAWMYLYRQCLNNILTTPDFTAVGDKVPLLDAMTALFSPATEARAQVRRSLASVVLIGRTLLREGRSSPAAVRQIARRARIGVILQDALATEKSAPGSIPLAINAMLYDNFHGIPRLNGGRLISALPDFTRDVSEQEARLQEVLPGGPLLSAEEHTAILHALLAYDLRQLSAEAAITKMIADSAAFSAIYSGGKLPDVVGLLNARFAAYAEDIDWSDPHHCAAPPFATTSGPSVYQCICGETFADRSAPLTPERLESLRVARTAHFRAVYRVRSKGDSWYPAAGSLHCNLHRAVQSVVAAQFTDATAFEPAMMPAVARYLLRDGKGFIYDPLLEESLRGALESYLSLRRAGQPHPVGLLTLEAKAKLEQRIGATPAVVSAKRRAG